MNENSVLSRIERMAFAECQSLRSLIFRSEVVEIGENSFMGCSLLSLLRFCSCECLKRIIGDATLNAWLEKLGFDEISSRFKIEMHERELVLIFQCGRHQLVAESYI
jgi:hypothetical protein